MRKFVFLFSILLLFSLSPAYTQSAVPADLNLFVNKVMQENKLPGIALAIVKDDAVVFAKGYGVRTLGKPELVDEHTLFQAASITKSFTTTLLGILADQGKINWTDPVTKYISEFETSEPFVTKQLTLQDLISLRSGLLGGDTLSGNNRNELISKIKNLNISKSFRLTQTSYNLNFTLAGYIAELANGKSWEKMMSSDLLIPLKMSESFTDIPSALAATKNVATPYYIENDKVLPIKWEDVGIFSPADALITNVTDLSNYIKLYLNNGMYENKLIINSKTLAEIQIPRIIVADFFRDYFNPQANIMAFGSGCVISDYKGMKIIQMAGMISGFTTLITLIPSIKLGIVIQTNMAGAFDAFVPINYKIIDNLLSK